MSNVSPPIDETIGASAFRVSMRGWLFVGVIGSIFCCGITPLWNALEAVDDHADYRVPYELSKDYWLYARHLDRHALKEKPYFVIGDSVVWGEYVRADGTLCHFLNQRTDSSRHFVNAGINGLFPLALEGLVRHHMPAVNDSDVLLHCNLLWMSNPDADMSNKKEQTFNHVSLVPQFRPQIPCYRASTNDRLGIVFRRQLNVFGWVSHLQQCYFDQQNIPAWTLKANGQFPAIYPNANRLPFGQVTLHVPSEPETDAQRGPNAERHRAWYENGMKPQAFEWVDPRVSMQWGAFQRLALELKTRGNRIRVVVGPFNEHMVTEAGSAGLQSWKRTVSNWCATNEIPCELPEPLASHLYGDASHPLTDGYKAMAQMIELE